MRVKTTCNTKNRAQPTQNPGPKIPPQSIADFGISPARCAAPNLCDNCSYRWFPASFSGQSASNAVGDQSKLDGQMQKEIAKVSLGNVSRLLGIDWRCRATWKRASYNTMWCLIGCSIGDMGTIAFFQFSGVPWPTLWIMALAMFNGILTSIILETFVLLRQMSFALALKTAVGMSLISMISMELAMNAVDWLLTGGARLTLWVLPPMWIAGFLTPLPYNYWRLKALGKACH